MIGVNNKLEMICKEVVMDYLEGAEENHRKLQSV
jgi:hypothetical protein